MSHGSTAPSRPDLVAPRARTQRSALGRRWARLGASPAGLRAQETLYLVVSGVAAVAGVSYLVGVGVLGSLLVLSVVGLPLAGVLVVTARLAGRAQRELVGVLLHEEVVAPSRFRGRPGVVGWTRSALGDAAGWRALAYLAVRAPVVIPGAALVVVAGAGGIMLVTHPVVRLAAAAAGTAAPPALGLGPDEALPWPQAIALAGLGAAVLLALPWVVGRLVAVDRWLVDRLLGPSAAEVRAEEARRTTILRAAGVLRHLGDPTDERVEVASGNGSGPGSRPADRSAAAADVRSPGPAGRVIGPGDPAPPGASPSQARPAPCTSGQLAADLVARASRSRLSVRLHLDLNGDALGPELDAIAREAADELLANAEASDADMAEVSVALGRRSLVLRVSDDGCGGAAADEGGGLERLSARLTGVDGLLVISSPEGGPTDVTVALPLGEDGGDRSPPSGAVREGQGAGR